ncbi:hypothetical protein G7Z99_18910 [Pseudomonas entomophila]|uniref:hypothetical protein n=1 Tax=Pseudomonas entomophila TaxID=312306 RepID=UPI0015E2AD97|nr:hypothetical protein [Pseudomonas entomophila]MBA1191092.1 hypothetical protein [Pseudomonas entomophila]
MNDEERRVAPHVRVIGAYGNFGRIVCRHLNRRSDIALTLAGRDSEALREQAAHLRWGLIADHRPWAVRLHHLGLRS